MLAKHIYCDFSKVSVIWLEISPTIIELTVFQPVKPLDLPSALWNMVVLGRWSSSVVKGSIAQDGKGGKGVEPDRPGSQFWLCPLTTWVEPFALSKFQLLSL